MSGFVVVSKQKAPFGFVMVSATRHLDRSCSHARASRGGRLVELAKLPFELNTRDCAYCCV